MSRPITWIRNRRLFLWERIREMNARGLTILLTTHDMDEADRLPSHRGDGSRQDSGERYAGCAEKADPGGTVLEVRARGRRGQVAGARRCARR